MKKITLLLSFLIVSLFGFGQGNMPPHIVSGNQIQVFYGGWSTENSWHIIFTNNGMQEDTVQSAGPLPIDYVFSHNGSKGLWPGEYEFRAHDTYGDGWMGPNGNGWFSVTPTIGVGTGVVEFGNPSGLLLNDFELIVPFTVYSFDSIDAGIINVLSPEDGPLLTSNEVFSVEVRNYGTQDLSPGDIDIMIYSYTHVTYLYQSNTTTLSTGETEIITFSSGFDMSNGGSYSYLIQAYVDGDDYINQNVRGVTITNEDFETIPWLETFSTNTWPGWTTSNFGVYNPAPSSWSGWAYTAARANFFYTAYGTIMMTTPCIYVDDLAYLTFDWSSCYNPYTQGDTLKVEISSDLGLTWDLLWVKGGNELSSEDFAANTYPGLFKSESIDLFDYSGDYVYVRFVGISGYGPDVFVDNVGVDYRCDNDLSLLDISVDDICALDINPLKVKIKNSGNNVIDSYSLQYEFNGDYYVEQRTETIYPSAGYIEILTNNVFDFNVLNTNEVDMHLIIPEIGLPISQTDDNISDNSLFKVIEKNDIINTFPFIENFESGESDYFNMNTGRYAQIYTDQAYNPTLFGDNTGTYLVMTGAPDPSNTGTPLWGGNTFELAHHGFEHIATYTSCPIDATQSGLTSLELEFEFKQFMKYHEYYSWFRVLADGVPIADTSGVILHNPITQYEDEYIKLNYDLTQYMWTPFVLTFETVNKYGMNTVYAPGNGAILDNIIIREIPPAIQTIELKNHWNIFSTYVEPQDPNIASVLEPIRGTFAMVKNGDGEVYWPWFEYNGIGNISLEEGYQISMFQDIDLDVFGTAVDPETTPISIDYGWSIISYLRNNPAAVEALFSSSNVILMSDGNGNAYWPQFQLNQVGDMEADEGFKILTSSSYQFTYPSNDSIITSNNKSTKLTPSYYDSPEKSGGMMFLAINSDKLELGDEVGIYSESGRLIGSAVAHQDKTVVVTIWGSESTLNENKNATTGERYIVEIYKRSEGKTFTATNLEFEVGSDIFANDSYAIIKSLDIPGEYEISVTNYPNPLMTSTMFEFQLNTNGLVTIELYDATGRFIRSLVNGEYAQGMNKEIVDLSDLNAGEYYYVMRTEGIAKTKRLTIL